MDATELPDSGLSGSMDSNYMLARLRRKAEAAITSDHADPDLKRFVSEFFLLDSHLSNGGTPPEVWREGPDAVGAETGPDAVGTSEVRRSLGVTAPNPHDSWDGDL